MACMRSRRWGTKHGPFKKESHHIVQGKKAEDQAI